MANKQFWDRVPHFKPHEFSHPHKMDESYLMALHQFRVHLGMPFQFNSTYRPDPKSNSRHSKSPCNAADIVIWEKWQVKALNVFRAYLLADAYTTFGGLGFYPWWDEVFENNPSPPGIHLDGRAERQRWFRDPAGHYWYLWPADGQFHERIYVDERPDWGRACDWWDVIAWKEEGLEPKVS